MHHGVFRNPVVAATTRQHPRFPLRGHPLAKAARGADADFGGVGFKLLVLRLARPLNLPVLVGQVVPWSQAVPSSQP